MQSYLTLTRRDLAGYFLSLSGYVIIATTTFLVGLGFVGLLVGLGNDPSPMPVTELFFRAWYGFWPILILTTPVITMRLFALERLSGTFETLMTTPVRDLTVVLAKFSAALIFYLVMWLPMLPCLGVVQYYARQSGALEWHMLASLFLGHRATGRVISFARVLCLGADAQSGGGRDRDAPLEREFVCAGLPRRSCRTRRFVAIAGAQPSGLVRSDARLRARRGGNPGGGALRQPDVFLLVPDLARRREPTVEITWKTRPL